MLEHHHVAGFGLRALHLVKSVRTVQLQNVLSGNGFIMLQGPAHLCSHHSRGRTQEKRDDANEGTERGGGKREGNPSTTAGDEESENCKRANLVLSIVV